MKINNVGGVMGESTRVDAEVIKCKHYMGFYSHSCFYEWILCALGHKFHRLVEPAIEFSVA